MTERRSRPARPARPRSPRSETERQLAAWGVKPDRDEKDARKGNKAASGKTLTAKAAPDGDKRKGKAQGQGPVRKRPDSHGAGKPSLRGERQGSGRARSAPRPAGGAPASPVQHVTRSDGLHRIAKLLARAGVASRRDIERMIEEGRVTLDGEPVTTPATLLPSTRGVSVDGKPVDQAEATRLFLFHKPAGCLTTQRDPAGRPTIYDHIPKDLPRLMPIGRLDMTTEGLLLLTNDGEFKRAMELPANAVERTYRARAFGSVSQQQLEDLIEGVEIDGIRYGRIDANLERRTGHNQWIEMTLTEGKNREVRRVLEHMGLKVTRLIRTRYGPFELADLPKAYLGEIPEKSLTHFRKMMKL